MCFGMGGGGSSNSTPQVSPQETAAIQAQEAYRKEQINNINNYDPVKTDVIGATVEKNRQKRTRTAGFNTDIVGDLISGQGGANDNAPSSALKKLMGA